MFTTKNKIMNRSINMKKYFFASLHVFIFTILSITPVSAAGTAFGTSITSTVSISAMNAETATGTTSLTVQAVYGIVTNSEADDSSITAGGQRDYQIIFTNNGNKTDVINLTLGAQSFGAGAGTSGDWSVTADDTFPYTTPVTWNGGATTANAAGDFASITLGPGAQGTFTVRITSTGTPSDGATMTVPVSLETSSTPACEYQGFVLNNAYGGTATAQRTVGASPPMITTTVQGVVFSIDKTADIQAPGEYSTLLSGSTSAPVPGSKITYTITYRNTGAIDAAGVVITDSIPANTHYTAGSLITSEWGTQGDTATDGDKCDYNVTNAGKITCGVGAVNANSPDYTIRYEVTID